MRNARCSAVTLAAVFSLTVAGCGSAASLPKAAANSPAAMAARIDSAALDPTIRPMAGVQRGWDPRLPSPHPAHPRGASPNSEYGYQDAGQGGLSILSGKSPKRTVNLVAYHALYHGDKWPAGGQITLDDPGEYQIGDVLLYAPTMKAPNGDCIEAGSAYYNGGPYTSDQTYAYIYAFDFCGGPGATLEPDTLSDWFDDYVRVNGDGVPEYAVQLCNCSGPRDWSIRYYNYVTNAFDTFYTTTGYYGGFGRGGWTQFETKYNVQKGTYAPCSPNLPAIEDTSVHFVEGNRDVYLAPKNSKLYQPLPGEDSFGAWGNCFNYDENPASYEFTLPYRVYDSWKVISTGY